MLMVGFQSPGIILWSRYSIGGLSCLGGGLRSLSALVLSLSLLFGVFLLEYTEDTLRNFIYILHVYVTGLR